MDDDADLEVRCGADPRGLDGWCARVEQLLADRDASVVLCDVADLGGSAAAVLDALARLQFTARRAGGEIRLRAPSPQLVELLRAVGLDDVVGVERPRSASD